MTSFDYLRVDCPFTVENIKSLYIREAPNAHVRMKLEVEVSEDVGFKPVLQLTNKEIHAYVLSSDNAEKEALFRGRIESVVESDLSNVHCVTIHAISATAETDVRRKRRSFQNKAMTYGELFDEIMGDYGHGQLINTIDDERPIPAPIVQYDETDWIFLIRMASHFNRIVYANAGQNTSRICVGLPPAGSLFDIAPVKYVAQKDIAAYRRAEANGANLSDIDFYFYVVETLERYAIGDRVRVFGHTLYVFEKETFIDNAMLCFRYKIGSEGNLYRPKFYNQLLAGLSMEGVVLDTINEVAKLHLEIDPSQAVETASWIPFAPPTGSLMYCMPQLGTTAIAHFPEADERKMISLGCIRKESDYRVRMMEDTNVRYLDTEHRSSIIFDPETLRITRSRARASAALTLAVTDYRGVTLDTRKPISIEAKGDINITSKKRITFATRRELSFKSKKGAFCNLSKAAHIKGDTMLIQTLITKPELPVKGELEKKSINYTKAVPTP